MDRAIIIVLILTYVFLSAFLETESGSRVTPADLLLLFLIMIAILQALLRDRLVVPAVHSAAVPMFLVFLVGSAGAFFVERAAFELFVTLFGFIGSLAIVNLLIDLPDYWLARFARGYILVIGALGAICLVNFLWVPGLVSSRNIGGLQGPFRNTGQAGSFFGVHSVLALALLVGRVAPREPQYLAGVAAALLALVFTLKRASLLAVLIGCFLFFFMLMLSSSARSKKIGLSLLFSSIVIGVFGFVLFGWALDQVPGLRWRLGYKYSVETLDAFSEGFIADNISSAFAALSDRPLIGVGLDNVREVYQQHEIHSTYLGILAYGGLLGAVAYLFFMGALFHTIYRESRHKLHNVWASFLYMLLPLLMGQMIGWGYTYHIRKREFWILVVFVTVAAGASRRLRLSTRFDGNAALSRPHLTSLGA